MVTPKIKSKNIYIQMDHASTVTKDLQILDRVQTILEKNGFTVHRVMGNKGLLEDVGTISQYILRNNITNSLIIHIVNGLYVPTIYEMVQTDTNDGKGYWYAQRAYKPKGNVGMQAYFFGAPDMFNPGGKYYEKLSTSKAGGTLVRPTQFMAEHGVLWTYEPNDYTGEATANAIVDLVNKNMGITPADSSSTNTSTEVPNTDSNQNKTLSEQVISETYTAPYYQQIFTLKTDELGCYNTPLNLPYAGKYKVDAYFAGTKDYQPYTTSSEIINYAGTIFQAELLEKIVTNKYTDGTNETQTTGNKTGKQHTTTTTKTSKYKDGAVSETTEKTTNSDKVKIVDPDVTNTVVNPSKVTPNTNNSNTTYRDPYASVIPTKDGVPDVNAMKHDGKTFELVDLTKMYTLTKQDYLEVFDRDSKSLQLNNYLESKYTAFHDKNRDKYYVVERERWNAVEESIYYYRAKEDGKKTYTWIANYEFPEEIVIDFPNKRTRIKDKDLWINWKAEKCTYHFCADSQDTNYTCGPTSSSVCSQVLHHYFSESEMQNEIHATSSDGSSPAMIQSVLNKKGFKAKLVWTTSKCIDWVKQNKPCVFHVYWHYVAWTDINEDGSKVLYANSSGSYHAPATGWASPYAKSIYNAAILVELNWSITEEEKQRINNFYKCMGGTWTGKPNTDETLRQYQFY